MAMLLVLATCLFRAKPLDFSGDSEPHPVRRSLALTTAVLFAAFVVAADLHFAVPSVIAVALVLAAVRRDAVLRIDWLLLIFVLMFVVLRGAAALPTVHGAVAQLGLDAPLRLYTAGAVLSQGISNVPAAILLSEFGGDWRRALAFGVSVGGFGFAIGVVA